MTTVRYECLLTGLSFNLRIQLPVISSKQQAHIRRHVAKSTQYPNGPDKYMYQYAYSVQSDQGLRLAQAKGIALENKDSDNISLTCDSKLYVFCCASAM